MPLLATSKVLQDDEVSVCASCLQAKSDVHERIDPYEADVNNNPDVHIDLCDKCYEAFCDDI